MTALQFTVPTVSAEWADTTRVEWDQVCVAVETYVGAGVFAAEDDGRYPWGGEVVTL